MATAALLSAHHATVSGEEPWACLVAGGISVLERQLRQARRVGPARAIIRVERMPPGLAALLTRLGDDVVVARDGAALAAALGDDDALLFAEGLVIDDRIVEAVMAVGEPALAVWTGTQPAEAERIDATAFWGGVARLGNAVAVHALADLGEWDMQSTLLRAAAAETPARIDISAMDDYAPARRRRAPLLWLPLRTLSDGVAASRALLAAAQKGCLDWPARWLHPPVEDVLTRLLLPTRVTPNMVTVATGVLGLAAGIAFATGWLWTGLVIALVVGPLDGVDGKLARTRIEYSRWGDLEHVLDKIVEYGWYLCLAAWFARSGYAGAWATAALIVLFALAEAGQGEFFRRFTGRQLDDAGEFERRFRLVSGRRNTFLWSLIPFAALEAWFAGFAMIAIYSVATFFVMQWRLFVRLSEYGRATAPAIAANLDATAYAFLSRSDPSAR